MGKNKKTFPKRNDEKSSNKPSYQEEEIKNLDDMSSENSEILPENLNNIFIYLFIFNLNYLNHVYVIILMIEI